MLTKKYVAPFLFGFLGILSFAPFSIKPLIFLSYAYLIKELAYKNDSSIKKLVFWSLGHWGFGMSWIIVSVYYYGNTNIYISLIIFFILVLILTAVFSMPLLVMKIRLFNGFKYEKIGEILYISSLLILSEWSMYYLLNGVPWIIPGIIFLDTITQNLYPILGVAGGSFIIYFLAALMAISWIKNKRLSYAFFILTFITLLPNTLYKNQTVEDINVSIIQPASDPFLKYSNGYKNTIENNLLNLYRNRSKESHIVIFPEAELPYALESKEFNEFSRKEENNFSAQVEPDNKKIDISVNETILTASLRNNVAHLSACGGTGKCSTCRVEITNGLENCSPRSELEQKLAKKLSFPENIRLGCQTTINGPVSYRRLLLDKRDLGNSNQLANTKLESVGTIRNLSIMFSDIRGFTPFSEALAAYDVIFILNRYFSIMPQRS